jgi:Uma2 family endonuclease
MSAVLQHPQRHPISAAEYLRMGEAGVFAPEARMELIEGEIIEMAPVGSPHAGTVAILTRALVEAAGQRAVVWTQNPLVLGERSVPQTDHALLKPRADSYTRSQLEFDLRTKVPLYARAGIAEAWVVDLQARALRVFRDPDASGYRTSFTASGEAKASAAALPQVAVGVAALFPE